MSEKNTQLTHTLSVKVPVPLAEFIRARAERELLSQSDIVRRVLLDRFQSELS